MRITLNAFPLKVPDQEIEACVIPYNKDQYDALKEDERGTYAIRRHGNDILVFSSNSEYPVTGKTKIYDLAENYGLLCFLVKDGVKRHLSSMDRQVSGFFPIELLSSKIEDDLLPPIIGGRISIPDRRQIQVRYTNDQRGSLPCY